MQYLWLPLLATWGCVMTMSLFWCVERVDACRLESARARRVYQRYGPMPSLIDDVPGDSSRHLHPHQDSSNRLHPLPARKKVIK